MSIDLRNYYDQSIQPALYAQPAVAPAKVKATKAAATTTPEEPPPSEPPPDEPPAEV